tara:strand:- start:678 stop:1055 length:378 start_codon:yes stop_codon:yes gene_type:complete
MNSFTTWMTGVYLTMDNRKFLSYVFATAFAVMLLALAAPALTVSTIAFAAILTVLFTGIVLTIHILVDYSRDGKWNRAAFYRERPNVFTQLATEEEPHGPEQQPEAEATTAGSEDQRLRVVDSAD